MSDPPPLRSDRQGRLMTPNSRPVPPAHTRDGLTASAGRHAVDVSELRRIHASLERAHAHATDYTVRVELQQAMDRLGRQIEAATT